MRYGFKSECERRALAARADLGLDEFDPLRARRLANHLGVTVIGVDLLPGVTPEDLRQLTGADPESWSAFTVAPPELTLMVVNTTHILTRQEADLMHECAHLLCGHRPAELVTLEGLDFPIRTFDVDQEEEADWFAGCLLLPRPALELAMRRSMSDFVISEIYGASYQMIKYRRRMTGVDRQQARFRGRLGRER